MIENIIVANTNNGKHEYSFQRVDDSGNKQIDLTRYFEGLCGKLSRDEYGNFVIVSRLNTEEIKNLIADKCAVDLLGVFRGKKYAENILLKCQDKANCKCEVCRTFDNCPSIKEKKDSEKIVEAINDFIDNYIVITL